MAYPIRCRAVRLAMMLILGALSAYSWPGERGPAATTGSEDDAQESRSNGPDAISVDLLRHPMSEKARRRLRKALDAMNAGDLDAARGELLELLTKYPDSAIYAQSVLGVIYVRTNRFEEAVNSFAVAASLLPHDAMTHYNFALSLACAMDYERAELEVRRSLELDPKNASAQTLLGVLLRRKQDGGANAPLAHTEISSGSERQSRD